jgi:DNA-binding PadR family transcriptional regulator
MQLPIFQILLGLLEGPATASDLIDAIARLDEGREPSLATFYRQLSQAEQAGLIAIKEKASPPSPGRPSQRYRITSTGRKAAQNEARRLQRLANVVITADHQAKA